MQVPHPFQQHRSRHDLPHATHEELQQLQLAPGELDLAPAPDHAPRQQIQLQVGDLEPRRLGPAGAAAQQRLDPGEKLREGKGLGEVVVAPGLQAPDPVIDRAECAQHQDGGREAPAAHFLDDREPVQVGQHAIGHDQIELSLRGALQPLAPVVGTGNLVAALTQPFDEELRSLGVVFDEKDVHGPQDRARHLASARGKSSSCCCRARRSAAGR